MPEREVILKTEDLCTWFPVRSAMGRVEAQVKAVDGVSLEIRRGEIYSLVGESGCGKSTFGRTVVRLLEPTGGRITLLGQDVTHLSERQLRSLRHKAQMIFQDPYTSFDPRQRVGDALMEALKLHGLRDRAGRQRAALGALARVGLQPEHFYRYPHEFSGGQRQRLGIARALALQPELIVCDEPVSALDVSIQAQVINMLKRLRDEDGLSYLFIAHDMSVVKYISDRIGVMYLGRLVEEAPAEELFAHPLHPYTQALFSAVPNPDPHQRGDRIHLAGELPSPLDPPAGCVFHTRCPRACAACAGAVPPLAEVRPDHRVACPYGRE